MLNYFWKRYYFNEWQKLIRHPQLRALWFLMMVIPIGLSVFVAQTQSFNATEGSITDLRTKLTMFFLGFQILVLPLCMLTFFIALQIEHSNNTFLWPAAKTIDEQYWVWGKWLMVFTTYIVVLMLSMTGSILWMQFVDSFKQIKNQVVQHWFWELAFHFIFLPVPAFLTMFLLGLLIHRYSAALLLSIGLTYAIEQRSILFAPFFALRYSLNLNMLLLSGTPIWQYSDLGKYYIIASAYSVIILVLIRYLIGRIGIYRLFNL